MMKKIPFKKIALYFFSALFVLLILLFLLKNTIFQYIVESKLDAFNRNHISQVHIKHYCLIGLSTVQMDSIYVTLPGDTFCFVKDFSVRFSPFQLLLGNLSLMEVRTEKIRVKIAKNDSSDSFSLLFKLKKVDTTDVEEVNKQPFFHKKTDIIFDVLFNLLPEEAQINDIKIQYARKDKPIIKVDIPFVSVHKYFLKMPVYITDGRNSQKLSLVSIIHASENQLYVKTVSTYDEKDYFPGYADIQLKAHVDTSFFSIKKEYHDHAVWLSGKGRLAHVFVQQPSVSYKDIQFDQLQMDYLIRISEHAITLDSSSNVWFNQLSFHPYIQYTAYPEKILTIRLNEPEIEADKFFASLPEGLFPNTSNIKAKGQLAYRLFFELNFNQIDSLKLESELRPNKFYISSYGEINLSKLDSDFIHIVYERGEPVDQIFVSYSNPNYVPLQQISPYLRNALLCTEDGAFYWHRGFIPEAFRDAMIENIKRKRFARGGSTITMQLVKNLFLNRHKVISRKLEEMLIVWLIENNRIVSKDRMFELYLNIIEFGPGVYGICKGSHFYFDKKPSELTLPEAIFIASIVPKPKRFASSFDSTGTLKPNVQDFLKYVAQKMLQKQMINEEEFNAFVPSVELKGPAKEFLKNKKNN